MKDKVHDTVLQIRISKPLREKLQAKFSGSLSGMIRGYLEKLVGKPHQEQ